jgi:hypothetical protein
MPRTSRARAVGVGKTAALFAILTLISFAFTWFDGVGGEGGVLLGFVYGAVAGYATVIIAIARDWITP